MSVNKCDVTDGQDLLKTGVGIGGIDYRRERLCIGNRCVWLSLRGAVNKRQKEDSSRLLRRAFSHCNATLRGREGGVRSFLRLSGTKTVRQVSGSCVRSIDRDGKMKPHDASDISS